MRNSWLWCAIGIALTACGGCREPESVGSEPFAQLSAIPVDDGVFAAWLGTAGVFVTDGVDALLIDPYVSRAGLLHVTLGEKLMSDPALVGKWSEGLQIPRGTPVLVSHSHFDHLLDAPHFVQSLGGRLIGSASTKAVGLAEGLIPTQVEAVAPGDAFEVGAFKVRVLPSCHAPIAFGVQIYPGDIVEPVDLPGSASTYKSGDNFSFVVEHPKGRIIHHASPCTVKGALHDVQAEVVLLGITGRSSTDDVLRDVVDAVGAKAIVPIHFDNFFAPLNQPMTSLPTAYLDEFLETIRVTRPDLTVAVLPIGQPTRVLPATPLKSAN